MRVPYLGGSGVSRGPPAVGTSENVPLLDGLTPCEGRVLTDISSQRLSWFCPGSVVDQRPYRETVLGSEGHFTRRKVVLGPSDRRMGNNTTVISTVQYFGHRPQLACERL